MRQHRNTGFDSIAWCYDAISYILFANRIRLSQTIYLGDLQDGAHLLIIGGGTGWILNEVFQHSGVKEITYVDISPQMLKKAQLNLHAEYQGSVHFILGTEMEIPATTPYDAIMTPFFLDLFTNARVKKIMERLYATLKPGGLWLLSDFEERKPFSFLNWMLLKGMYFFFRRVCNIDGSDLPDLATHFHRMNLKALKSTQFYGKNIRASLYEKPF